MVLRLSRHRTVCGQAGMGSRLPPNRIALLRVSDTASSDAQGFAWSLRMVLSVRLGEAASGHPSGRRAAVRGGAPGSGLWVVNRTSAFLQDFVAWWRVR